ncbi:type I DNA topoisomerase [Dethiosulfatarculus sandiegensis]|uniref:DNA topoisomerase 1 n=1 Tax=Dethiosulfatarculus sandiegensis TaxID=1429043 RepID=A0A0D2GMN4_9BACT|nr:type I DNA topoisomerase [Dethiosulfatarculus sandiegensis]KIX15912.1 DNA topoisomerase I [Dethiosulfatarculus sandiegensis]
MPKSLLIVESPAKARTIKKYLGKNFEVMASVGHIVDLPPTKLGVDLEHNFDPAYQVIKGKEKVVRELKKAAKKANSIYLAPDPDREGEAIAWHIAQELGGSPEEYKRVLFHELTKKAIKQAVENPNKLDINRFDSQQARRILDRLVGYQISPILWDKVKRGLSAGRVQSVALRLVVERERAIQAFEPQEYWTVTADLKADEPPVFTARLAKFKDKKFDPKNEKQADEAVKAVKEQPFIVQKVTKRERKQNPAPPFITSTLQQEAYRKLGYTPKRTMALAQRLYEGLETAEGQVGLITYMRTDSTRLADEALAEVRDLIEERFGKEYVPAKPAAYKSRSSAQEAHEAIRPTSSLRTPESVKNYLKRDELALYRLIWNRFVACQMAPARYDRTQAEITAGPGLFRASGQILKFKGFTAVYVEDKDEKGGKKIQIDKDGLLPPLAKDQVVDLVGLDPKQHFTQPPPRFTEASLVRELEEKGIGRPSTYASILSTLQDKEYVTKFKKRHLIPSPLGMIVTDLLVESFSRVMEVDFTAGLERELDDVEEGKRNWRELLTDFYGPFSHALEKAKTEMRQIKGKGMPTDIKCPTCGQNMSIRLGKHGEFLACDGYPECKTTRDFTRDDNGKIIMAEPLPDPGINCSECGAPMQVKNGPYGSFLACSAYPKCRNIMELDEEGNPKEKEKPEATGEKCPKCGHELVIKKTRVGGKFISCSNYPKCRYSRGMPTGVKCPDCGADLVEKRSRRGKPFYGCDNYPKCQYATWNKPLPEPCPDCNHPFLVLKTTKAGQTVQCPNKECGYKRDADE